VKEVHRNDVEYRISRIRVEGFDRAEPIAMAHRAICTGNVSARPPARRAPGWASSSKCSMRSSRTRDCPARARQMNEGSREGARNLCGFKNPGPRARERGLRHVLKLNLRLLSLFILPNGRLNRRST
jgi:hypothetical protein